MTQFGSKDLAIDIACIAKEHKAEKVNILDLRKLSAFCDFFVIMTGTSSRHIAGLAERIEEGLTKKKVKSLFSRISSHQIESGWCILDYADVVVHIFQKEQREFYSLENLWQEAKTVRMQASLTKKTAKKKPASLRKATHK